MIRSDRLPPRQKGRGSLRAQAWPLVALALITVGPMTPANRPIPPANRPIPPAAQTKTLIWESYDVNLAVQANGDLAVEERQRIRFTSGTFTQGYAIIPTDKTEGIDSVSVRDGDGRQYESVGYSSDPYTFSAQPTGGGLEIIWSFPPVSDAVRTFTLAYTVHGAIRVSGSGDTLQWIAIDNERDFPIEAATATVELPPGASFLEMDSAGVSTQWNQTQNGTAVVFQASQSLSPYDTLEVGVHFTHGFIPDRAPSWQAAEDVKDTYELTVRPLATLGFGVLAVAIGLGGPLLVYLLWYLRGRDPKVDAVPEYLAEPPGTAPPGVLGTLVDERADMPDITATIVDLARRGHLTMQETETTLWGSIRSKDFVFHRLEQPKDNLLPFEAEILQGLFPGQAAEQKLSGLQNKFYVRLPGIQRKLYDELINFRYFSVSPESVRGRWRGIGLLITILGFVGLTTFSVFLAPLAVTAPCALGAVIVLGIAMTVAAQYMPVKTRTGAEATARWMAFRTYLSRIEQLTDLKQATDLFEKYLPYAVALGVSQAWVQKFAGLESVPAPGWYGPLRSPTVLRGAPHVAGAPSAGAPSVGGQGAPSRGGLEGLSQGMSGGLQGMSDGLTHMLNSAGRVMRSAPSSSGHGGGGFSGGGFRGGGGGGGGGRGFH